MIKEILKPFDLKKSKQGATIMTECHNKARIICYDLKANAKNHPLLVLITDNGIEYPAYYKINGTTDYYKCYGNLKIVEEVEVSDRWRDRNENVTEYVADSGGKVLSLANSFNKCVSGYATEKEALREYAARKISHIIANDERFGGPLSYWDWQGDNYKHIIERFKDEIIKSEKRHTFTLLAFHTMEQRDLFFKENQDLLKQYFML